MCLFRRAHRRLLIPTNPVLLVDKVTLPFPHTPYFLILNPHAPPQSHSDWGNPLEGGF
jgi:hypothetical protein